MQMGYARNACLSCNFNVRNVLLGSHAPIYFCVKVASKPAAFVRRCTNFDDKITYCLIKCVSILMNIECFCVKNCSFGALDDTKEGGAILTPKKRKKTTKN